MKSSLSELETTIISPSRWSFSSFQQALHRSYVTSPPIAQSDIIRLSASLDIWDAWPVQADDGHPVRVAPDTTLWMALGAPHFEDPDERHGHARIHLLQHDGQGWQYLGPAMPDGFSPGSREWSGSAVLAADGVNLTLYFTATGRRGEPLLSFEQRLFSASATLDGSDGTFRFVDWRDLAEIVQPDPAHYMPSDAGTGAIGTIKAFRDPAYFRDPLNQKRYLFFAGSAATGDAAFNGVVGAAVAGADEGEPWNILPPLIDASGLCNELERPHVIMKDDLYYLFWSTQSHVFAPGFTDFPTGLYGMVSSSLQGGWRPLNGSGLVFANPLDAPRQAYSWLVLPDLSVISFIDDWGRAARAEGPRRIGATFAPVLRLSLSGDNAGLDI